MILQKFAEKYTKDTDTKNFAVTVLVVFCLSYIAYRFVPGLEKALTSEKRLIETATVFFYIAASAILVGILRNTKTTLKSVAGFCVLFFAILFILEESSFGRDYIYFYDRPKIYDVPIDAVHDFLLVTIHVIKGGVNSHIAAIFGTITLISTIIALAAYRKWHITRELLTTTAAKLTCTAIAFLVVAAVLDSELFDETYKTKFLEEQFELYASIGLYFAAKSIRSIKD